MIYILFQVVGACTLEGVHTWIIYMRVMCITIVGVILKGVCVWFGCVANDEPHDGET